MGEQMAYPRDASWYDRPSVNGAKYYHREGNKNGDRALAFCSSRIILNVFGAKVTTLNGLLCKRCFGGRSA